MIGPKKLSAIRQELHSALTAIGKDPIDWLDERMAAPKHQVSKASGESDVLLSLRRILAKANRVKRQKRRIATKK
jgi:hypothetical protein